MGLLSALFGHHDPNAPSPNAPPPQVAPPQVDPASHPAVGSLVQHLATVAPSSALTQPAPPQASPQAPPQMQGQAPITVTGQAPPADTWKPHHAGLLGQVADYLLNTHFGKENWRRNMTSAMENIDKDPMGAVKRVAQFDPETAEKMYEKVVDNQRADGAQNRMNHMSDITTRRYTDTQVGGMLYKAAQSKNPSVWRAAVAQAQNIGNIAGVDYSFLPDSPDPADMDMYANGYVPAPKQMVNNTNVARNTATDAYRKASLAERSSFHKGELGVQQGSLAERAGYHNKMAGIAQQNADTGVAREQTAAQRASIYAQANQGRTVNSRMGAGVVSKNGTQLTIFGHDGKTYLYLRGPDGNHWKFAHQLKGTDEKARGTAAPEVPDEEDVP